jgi:uncharacterized membrane protein YbhN (UPF0104 family)
MSDPAAGRGRWRAALQAIVSIGFLTLVVVLIDEDVLVQRIAALDPSWVALALAATLPQFILSAARWRLTAERLGADLPFKTALGEYYLAVLTNQILPGGVLGDAARAIRHGRRLKADDRPAVYGPAVRAVVYERASGQFVLFFVMLTGLTFWPRAGGIAMPVLELAGISLLVLLILVLVALLAFRGPIARTRLGAGTRGALAEAGYALLAPEVVVRQALYSLGVLATYVFCFYCAARAIGIELSFAQSISFIPAILFAMTVPITVGGWGIREAAAAAVWGIANLTPADGVAVSVTYGIIVLISALPGIFFLIPGSRKNDLGHKG